MIQILRINAPIIALCLIIWFAIAQYFDLWSSLSDSWPIAIIMMFGAFIAGASSEGGGAIAFPALTLLYGFPPAIGASFSLAIQSFGMTSASHYIIRSKIKVCWPVIRAVLPVAFLGYLVGRYEVAGELSPKIVKIFFVSFWLSFGFVMLAKNYLVKNTCEDITIRGIKDYIVIALFGFFGGMISAVVGSGIDILTFTMMILWFNLSEKVATPTTVILMASLSIFGTLVQALDGGLNILVLQFLIAAIPVVIFIAPLGAKFISGRNRLFISRSLFVILAVQYLGALIILKVDTLHLMFSFAILIGGCLFFYIFGKKHLNVHTQNLLQEAKR